MLDTSLDGNRSHLEGSEGVFLKSSNSYLGSRDYYLCPTGGSPLGEASHVTRGQMLGP